MASFDTAEASVATGGPQQAGPRPGLFERLAEEPALLELAFLAAIGLFAGWVILRLRARARACEEERAVGDLVFGLVLAEDGQWDAALPRLEQARSADPGRASVRLARARVLLALGRSEEAHAEHLALRRQRGPDWTRNEEGLRAALRASEGDAGDAAGGMGPATGTVGRSLAASRLAADEALRPVSAAARTAVVDPPRRRLERITDPGAIWDAIRADPDHVERLCAAPGPHHVEDVVALGVEAAPSLLRAAMAGGDAAHLAAVVRAIGPSIGPALVEAARSNDRFPEAELRSLLSALGPEGAGPLASHLGSADRRLRHALIDVHLGMADVAVFERVLDAVPLVDVVQRCNAVQGSVLVPFLASLPEGHFLFDMLLPDGGFVRDAAVLAAIPGSTAPEALERLLARRGAARSLCSDLVRALVDPDLAAVAGRLLDGFGERAIGPMVLAFADPELGEDVRAAIRVRLVGMGAAAVGPLCGCVGAHPTELDADVVSVLAAIGDAAVPALRDACLERGLLARLNPGGRRRGAHRRAMAVRALGRIGSMQARAALTTLRAHESDPEVLLRISQALHRLDDTRPGGSLQEPRSATREEVEDHG